MREESMRMECPACERLAVPAGFRLEGGRLLLTCGRCGAEHVAFVEPSVETPGRARSAGPSPGLAANGSPGEGTFPAPMLRVVDRPLEAPGERAAEAPFTVPEGHCPKCVAPSPPSALSCAACGLVFANHVPALQVPAPPLAAAWQHLLGRWEDRAAHDAVLAQAQAGGQLAVMGRLYRIHLARHPGDPQARRALEEIVRLALLPSDRAEARPDAAPGMARALKLVLAVLFLLLCLTASVLLLRSVAPPVP